jgi:hypothetical protein
MAELTADELVFFSKLQSMPDTEFMEAWHKAISVGDEPRLALIESTATGRFGIAAWVDRYIAQYPNQTRYQRPPTGRVNVSG